MHGPYCNADYPPTLQSIGNRFKITHTNYLPGLSSGFVAYYESLGPVPSDATFRAASLMGTYYSKAIAFLKSPMVDVTAKKHCLTFSYSMRSNLRVKATFHRLTITLANWIVDGGRAFHRAVLDLPQGVYKIIWETTNSREDTTGVQSPYNRHHVTVDEIFILPHDCRDIGMLYSCNKIQLGIHTAFK